MDNYPGRRVLSGQAQAFSLGAARQRHARARYVPSAEGSEKGRPWLHSWLIGILFTPTASPTRIGSSATHQTSSRSGPVFMRRGTASHLRVIASRLRVIYAKGHLMPKLRRPRFRAPVHSVTLTPKRTLSRVRIPAPKRRSLFRRRRSLQISTTRVRPMWNTAATSESYTLRTQTRRPTNGINGTGQIRMRKITGGGEPILRCMSPAATGS